MALKKAGGTLPYPYSKERRRSVSGICDGTFRCVAGAGTREIPQQAPLIGSSSYHSYFKRIVAAVGGTIDTVNNFYCGNTCIFPVQTYFVICVADPYEISGGIGIGEVAGRCGKVHICVVGTGSIKGKLAIKVPLGRRGYCTGRAQIKITAGCRVVAGCL